MRLWKNPSLTVPQGKDVPTFLMDGDVMMVGVVGADPCARAFFSILLEAVREQGYVLTLVVREGGVDPFWYTLACVWRIHFVITISPGDDLSEKGFDIGIVKNRSHMPLLERCVHPLVLNPDGDACAYLEMDRYHSSLVACLLVRDRVLSVTKYFSAPTQPFMTYEALLEHAFPVCLAKTMRMRLKSAGIYLL
ncbi:hypothetical protein KBD61_01090 [Patescibacteria group bacterium]|nr:hypothetical protein [Patescibacteria group bacterium]MBP9709604.1 hypothetical protein [Patescibacteria group bacterium]